MNYSIKKGLGKGIVSALVVAGAFLVFVGLSDVVIWDLLEKYLKPVLGAMTFGGAVTMLINWIKVKSS